MKSFVATNLTKKFTTYQGGLSIEYRLKKASVVPVIFVPHLPTEKQMDAIKKIMETP